MKIWAVWNCYWSWLLPQAYLFRRTVRRKNIISLFFDIFEAFCKELFCCRYFCFVLLLFLSYEPLMDCLHNFFRLSLVNIFLLWNARAQHPCWVICLSTTGKDGDDVWVRVNFSENSQLRLSSEHLVELLFWLKLVVKKILLPLLHDTMASKKKDD